MKIIEAYSECGVDAGYIVRRIMSYLPTDEVGGIREVRLLDYSPGRKGFARYITDECTIEVFIREIVDWQPWLLKKSFFFPYLAIGLALGHELDHHVHRAENGEEKERSAELNAMKYVYPSLGVFKPLVWLVGLLARIAAWRRK